MNGTDISRDGIVFGELYVNGAWEKAVYFHLPDEPNGFLSNWYPAQFTLDGRSFTSAEQYIMYRKCLLMGDERSADLVLGTDDPKKQQEIGRDVHPYNEVLWEGVWQAAAVRCLMAKFGQNAMLKEKLLATGDAYLVECAHKDRIWACGRGREQKQSRIMSEWEGKSILGFALMEVRAALRQAGAADLPEGNG